MRPHLREVVTLFHSSHDGYKGGPPHREVENVDLQTEELLKTLKRFGVEEALVTFRALLPFLIALLRRMKIFDCQLKAQFRKSVRGDEAPESFEAFLRRLPSSKLHAFQ